MHGRQSHQGATFNCVSLEELVPAKHPLRAIRAVVDKALAGMDGAFAGLYPGTGRLSEHPQNPNLIAVRPPNNNQDGCREVYSSAVR